MAQFYLALHQQERQIHYGKIGKIAIQFCRIF